MAWPEGMVELGDRFSVHLDLLFGQQTFDVVAGFSLYMLQQKREQGVLVFRHERKRTGRFFDAVILFFHGEFSFLICLLFSSYHKNRVKSLDILYFVVLEHEIRMQRKVA